MQPGARWLYPGSRHDERVSQVEILTSPEALEAEAAGWDALAAAHPDPFSTTAWLAAWWRAFGAGGRSRVLVARRDGDIVGGLPVGMANEHSPLTRVLGDEATRRELVAAALREAPSLTLLDVPEADAPAPTGLPVLRRPGARAPIVETTGTFEDWRAGSKPRWGAPLERFRRKMGRENGLVLRLNESPADLERELERGFAVEGSGWKGRAGTAIVSRPETERFYREVAAVFAARGELACSSLELDGRMAAWDLSLLHAGRVFLLKTGFDEEFRKLAPGLVLRLSVIEDCFERGHAAHELLGTVDDWKPKFATTERPHVTLVIGRRSPAGLAVIGGRMARAAASRLKARVKG